jgi:hypothetical protein
VLTLQSREEKVRGRAGIDDDTSEGEGQQGCRGGVGWLLIRVRDDGGSIIKIILVIRFE